MRFDPLVPVPLIVAGAVVMLATVVARVIRAGIGLSVLRGLLMGSLAVAVAADPYVAGGTSEARRISADVVFVVDSTGSMGAIDWNGDSQRLDGARADILELAAGFPGSHFSIVRFDGQARIELPWTTDVAALEIAVSVIRPERAVYSQGTNLELPLDVLGQLIPRPGSVQSMTGQDADSYVVVFYLSDGERRAATPSDRPPSVTQPGIVLPEDDGTEQPATSFTELAPDVDGGAVLGYGTTDGAPMIQFHGTDELFTADSPYVFDYATGETAMSRIDEDSLSEIADELGVPYLHRSEPGGLIGLASDLAGAAPIVSDGSRDTRDRLYWIPALGLLAVVLWQTLVTATEARTTRRLLSGAGRPAAWESAAVADAAVRQRTKTESAA